MTPQRHYVYYLRNAADPDRYYVGTTSNPNRRLHLHNEQLTGSTAPKAPWHLHATFWFRDTETARHFERYLKSGSGRAFAKRHF